MVAQKSKPSKPTAEKPVVVVIALSRMVKEHAAAVDAWMECSVTAAAATLDDKDTLAALYQAVVAAQEDCMAAFEVVCGHPDYNGENGPDHWGVPWRER